MTQEKKPLTGADIRLDAEAKSAIVTALAEKMRLRQWCAEQAVKSAGYLDSSKFCITYFENMTKFFYDFITKTEEKTNEQTP
jgi:hypothetical protein